jgi:hypothetical protein
MTSGFPANRAAGLSKMNNSPKRSRKSIWKAQTKATADALLSVVSGENNGSELDALKKTFRP